MNRRQFLTRSAAVAALAALPPALCKADDSTAPESLNDLLAPILKSHALPAVAAAFVKADRIAAQGVAGVREIGQPDPVTLQDKFLIGSCTKRMTALMTCRLIDAGQLSFDTTLAAALPGLPMRDDYRPVTIAQLLTFTGGIPAYTRIGPQLTPVLFQLKGTPDEQRDQFIHHLLQEPPAVKPGTERLYSNASYALLAFVAAHKTAKTWESLIQEHVFQPLRMTASGFGRPRTKDHPDQPAPHVKGEGGYQPEPDDRPGVHPVLAGAGAVHCDIHDFATFAIYELAGARGHDPLLKPETAKRWREGRMAGREGSPVFGGSQSITAAYVTWPSKNAAAAVMTNAGAAADACTDFFKAALDRFG